MPRVGPGKGLFAIGGPEGTAPGVPVGDPGAGRTPLQRRGFPGPAERLCKAGELPNDLVPEIRNRTGQFDEGSVVLCVQLHAFERLLFCNVGALGRTLPCAPVAEHRSIRSELGPPKGITSHPDTAPNRRIETPVPRYRKALHGTLPALGFGLEKTRGECPRFDARLGRPASA